jgi:flagellar M-ring protein FliF
VEGLQPEAVTILDTQGTMLHGAGSPGSDLLDTALYSSKQYAEALSTRLQTMLDAIFGPGKTIVRAQVDLDLDTEQSREEKVDPVTPHSTDAVSREHQTKETYAGNRGGAGGVSGVPAGIMGGGAAAGASGAGSYTNSQETREYEFSRRTTDRARRPGRIRRMSIAAVVDEAVASAGVSRVQDIVQAAAGLDLARGDTLVVRAMKLGGAEEAAKEATLAQADAAARSRRAIIEMLVSRGLPMVLALVLISLLARTAADVRRGVTRSSEAAAGSDSAGWQPPSGWPEQTGNAERISETMPSAPLSEEDTMVAELRRIARDQPELLAEELRNLISGQGE